MKQPPGDGSAPPVADGKAGSLSIFSGPVDDPPSDWEVVRAIWAIPLDALDAPANKLLCIHINHCGCGRSTSFASNDTLAFEAGMSVRHISRINVDLVHGNDGKPNSASQRGRRLMQGGWLIEHRHGTARSKHAEREFEIGPTTWEWVRRNLAAMAARRQENEVRRKTSQVGQACPTRLDRRVQPHGQACPTRLDRRVQHNSSLNSSNKPTVNSGVRLYSPLEEEKSKQEAVVNPEEAARKNINRWIDVLSKDTPDLDQVETIMSQRIGTTAYDRELIRQEIERRKTKGGG